ncbi:MAG: gliding motility-associated ABC transporter permease subunit GldF [Bacteroidia bacterium]|nr:MAG: gliding motility-associated ABC transporter permease subunit GldF [Bacteroidia bacterium]
MKALFLKEIRSYLNSLTGFLVILVFLIVTSLFLWIIPNEATGTNILENGFASLESLFSLAPWVFLILIPAVSMKLFSEENKAGTMELLLTKPLTELQIVLAKYLAGFVIILFSLLPTLFYYYTVYQLGFPKGNIDVGGTWGSYIGLFFLASSFLAIGIFASVLTDNQVIAFLLALVLCYLFHNGFDFLASFKMNGVMSLFISSLGIQYHYYSMSRGVVDSRDVLYFLTLIIIFILATRLVLQSRKW